MVAERAKHKGQSMQAYLLDLITSDVKFGNNPYTFDLTKQTRNPVNAETISAIIAEGRSEGSEIDRTLLA